MNKTPKLVVVLAELSVVYVTYRTLPESDRTMIRMRILSVSAQVARRLALSSGLLAIRLEQAYGKVSANG